MERFHISEWHTTRAWAIAEANEDRIRRVLAGERRIRELNLSRDAIAVTALSSEPKSVNMVIKLPETATAARLDKVA